MRPARATVVSAVSRPAFIVTGPMPQSQTRVRCRRPRVIERRCDTAAMEVTGGTASRVSTGRGTGDRGHVKGGALDQEEDGSGDDGRRAQTLRALGGDFHSNGAPR